MTCWLQTKTREDSAPPELSEGSWQDEQGWGEQGEPARLGTQMLHPEVAFAGSVPRASPRAEWPEQQEPG